MPTRSLYTCFLLCICFLSILSCQPGKKPEMFTVSGTFSNTGATKIFLAELPFGSTQRTIVDTAQLDEKGNFTLSTISKGEGIYQVFIEKGPGMMLINDADKIEVHVDARNIASYTTNSKTNESLKSMYKAFIVQDSIYRHLQGAEDSIGKMNIKDEMKDSLIGLTSQATSTSLAALKRMLKVYIETDPNGTAVYFATGIAKKRNSDEEWNALLQTALKRFPNHPGLQLLRVNSASQNSIDQQGKQLIGKPVPDISLPDSSDKQLAVSSFKGKWLLVDFWASWCAPCRAENPNVVAMFNVYKSKNFTVLGISLDLQKGAWLKAIRQDGLAWNHISDLKQWQSQAVEVYGFNGIPFNILVDPQGIVAAVNLRGKELQDTLAAKIK